MSDAKCCKVTPHKKCIVSNSCIVSQLKWPGANPIKLFTP